MTRDAFLNGLLAYMRGDLNAPPFPSGSTEGKAWLDGWLRAEEFADGIRGEREDELEQELEEVRDELEEVRHELRELREAKAMVVELATERRGDGPPPRMQP
jgi:hypothetical protein